MSRWWIDGQAFTCRNRRFQTDINNLSSYPHGQGHALGSVFAEPLVNNGGYTLWLEHVEDYKRGDKMFWLMWYNVKGVPTIPASGVFDRIDVRKMVGQLSSFIEVP